ncbi:hypothetical protein EYF80_019993 [Liparis tanakae]|uniref:Uncharacterized protein n=1 Tax=Liparis tanakae TaxID=230148 RepID=A0A4Z2HVZ8_9TELE|nr:hypothetical protein EYF80_019993 [Liparis tanakae]
MTHRTSRASSTVARALQMTAARAMSRGLVTTEGSGTRFTRPLPVEKTEGEIQSPHTALLVVEQLSFWKRLMSPQSRQGLHFCRLRSSLKRLLRQGTHRASSP